MSKTLLSRGDEEGDTVDRGREKLTLQRRPHIPLLRCTHPIPTPNRQPRTNILHTQRNGPIPLRRAQHAHLRRILPLRHRRHDHTRMERPARDALPARILRAGPHVRRERHPRLPLATRRVRGPETRSRSQLRHRFLVRVHTHAAETGSVAEGRERRRLAVTRIRPKRIAQCRPIGIERARRTNSAERERRRAVPGHGHTIANRGLRARGRHRFPVGRDRGHALVDVFGVRSVFLLLARAEEFEPGEEDEQADDEEGHDYSGGDLAAGETVGGGWGVVDLCYRRVAARDRSRGGGRARCRCGVGACEDGTGGESGHGGEGTRLDDGELEGNGGGRIPPFRLEVGLVVAVGVVDVRPLVDLGGVGGGSVEIDVDVGAVEAGGVPGDVEGRSVFDGVARGGREVEAASGTSWEPRC